MPATAQPPDAASLLDPKLLRLFDLLYSTHSVTRAAQQLGQSQPTVSIWLGQLRAALGDPLFVRTSQGMQPSPRADALAGPVREVLAGLRALSDSQQAFAPDTATRTFRVCMTDASHITLLPRLLAHMRAVAPQVRLDATRIDAQLSETLETGGADVALGFLPWLETGFYAQTLYEQDWVCLTNGHHPRLNATLSLAQYKEEGHIYVVSGTGQDLLDAALRRHRIERRVLLGLPGFLGLASILSTTDLIATLPRHIGESLAQLGGLQVFDCPFRVPTFTVKQYWHARYHHDPANRWLREVCAQLFMKTPD